jgi:hypothetical protein
MDTIPDRAGRRRNMRSLLNRIDEQLRLQRELLWHPRLGLAGPRQAVPIRVPARSRRSWSGR